MSGVCAKHHGYVQPGEVCPYCEPSCDFVLFAGNLAQVHPAQPPIDVIGSRMAHTNAAIQASIKMGKQMACDHKNRSVNRDACEDCGMSGMEIAQRRTATDASIRARYGARQWMTGLPAPSSPECEGIVPSVEGVDA